MADGNAVTEVIAGPIVKATEGGLELDLSGVDKPLSFDSNIPDIGKIEALTDAIILLFQDLEIELNNYLTTYDIAEKAELHYTISRFLSRLNANRLIPLSFRLQSLRTFSKEIRFLDLDLTTAILNAYRVAVQIVMSESGRRDEEYRDNYLLELANLCGEAIALGVQVARLQLEQYWEPGAQLTWQIHELTRVGLAAITQANYSNRALQYQHKICNNIVWFELMREADFFQLTHDGQTLLYESLSPYLEKVQPIYCQKNTMPEVHAGHSYLVSYVGGRYEKPRMKQILEPKHERDRLLLDITQLLPILEEQFQEAKSYMDMGKKSSIPIAHTTDDTDDDKKSTQHKKLKTEDEVYSLYNVSRHLLRCLQIIPHREKRKRINGQQLIMIDNLDYSLTLPHKPAVKLGTKAEIKKYISEWVIRDISAIGIGVDANQSPKHLPQVTNLVRLVWQDKDSTRPLWAQIRWRRHRLNGKRVHMGMKFLPKNIEYWTTHSMRAGQAGLPILAMRSDHEKHAIIWTSNTNVQTNSGTVLNIDNKLFACKILNIIQRGSNFRACEIRIVRSFVPMQSLHQSLLKR
ncbi:MAG: hypothetical protein R8K21_04330 [Mariprofundales bacterium]